MTVWLSPYNSRPAFISAKQLGYRAIPVQPFQYWTVTEFVLSLANALGRFSHAVSQMAAAIGWGDWTLGRPSG